ncbi:MAG: hypothetical protein ACFFE4_17025 [Candidatus Thorarchaeota archaeon]
MFFKIKGENIPLVMAGTSPFIGAGQFGGRAYEYRRKFLFNIDAMLDILESSYKFGSRGIEVIPDGKICDAVKIMTETYNDYIVTGSTFPGMDPLIEELINISAKIIFVHGMVSDNLDKRLSRLLDDISSRGVIPGIAVHNPIPTLEFCFKNLKEIKTYLIPFNVKGFIMGNQLKLETMIDNKKDYFFVGMKTLAAGHIDPKVAFDYISRHNICSVTIGMTTTQEAINSTKIALESLTRKVT